MKIWQCLDTVLISAAHFLSMLMKKEIFFEHFTTNSDISLGYIALIPKIISSLIKTYQSFSKSVRNLRQYRSARFLSLSLRIFAIWSSICDENLVKALFSITWFHTPISESYMNELLSNKRKHLSLLSNHP